MRAVHWDDGGKPIYLGTERCMCGDLVEDHDMDADGRCLCPGCDCEKFEDEEFDFDDLDEDWAQSANGGDE